jgi:hypothetical protein
MQPPAKTRECSQDSFHAAEPCVWGRSNRIILERFLLLLFSSPHQVGLRSRHTIIKIATGTLSAENGLRITHVG